MSTDQQSPLRDRLLQSLDRSDARRRDERADRILWLSKIESDPGAFSGPIDTYALRSEARYSYIEGHFIGTVLLAMAFVEQVIIARVLEKRLTTYVRIFISRAIPLAEEAMLFDADLLKRVAEMAERRNGYAHLKALEDEHPFAHRFLEQRRHPRLIREQDAQEALELMDEFFRVSLGLPRKSAGPCAASCSVVPEPPKT